jgi:hypothetical protein
MREEVGDIWQQHSQGHWIGLPTNGEISASGAAVMNPGLATIAALRFPPLKQQLGELLAQSGNHVFAFPDYRLFTIPTMHGPTGPADPVLIARSAEECLRYVNHLQLPALYTVPLGCGLEQLDWSTVRPLLSRIWDDRFIILTTPYS